MEKPVTPRQFQAPMPNNFDIPRRINRLPELAYNLWWSWFPEAMRLFVSINRDLWERTDHNPLSLLRRVDRAQLNALAQNSYFRKQYDQVFQFFDAYLNDQETWFTRTYPELSGHTIAYFSMEFGLHETLPLYAGGLGVLSGDHLKEASDLGFPMVAVGFLYTKGYFSQRITQDGWQEKRSYTLDLDVAPVLPLLGSDGKQVEVQVNFPGRTVALKIWQVRAGRVPLYLLDSDVDSNTPIDRELTANLYSGNPEMRIQQEILLGMGGVQTLSKLGYHPTIWHMNEGHSAFLSLERAREMVQRGITFADAARRIRATNIFTTHTPVPAGNDEFPIYLVEKYLSVYWAELGLTRAQFLELGTCQRAWGEAFSMPVLALRLSEHNNAVSELHGRVTRQMWQFLWPNLKPDDVPITSVTNGVHTGTWLARRLRILFSEHLGADWMDHLDDPLIWDRVLTIPDEKLWEVRRHLKRKLVLYLMERARQQWRRGEIHPVQVIASGVLLDPYVLTIGFARRFAPYKRADLVLSDLDRLYTLLNQPNMPVQIIFAGKSHPDNEPGKLLIQEVYRNVKKSESGGRLVFLEEYDMNLARYLVQGVDIWLNTPRRPLEASGTSGQKAALNGVLNFSILDGWWREGFNGHNGWAIGEDTDPVDPEQQDARDARDLYRVLENEIIPMYYQERTPDGLPTKWIGRIKESMRTLAPQFSTRRMLKEYMQRLYLPGLLHDDNS
jgi:starch phosphorylase